MKRFLPVYLLLLMSAASQTCYSQWVQTYGPLGGYVNCVTRVNGAGTTTRSGGQIWAGTANGIYISYDEGATWQVTSLFSGYYVMQIYNQGDTLLVIYNTIEPGDLETGSQVVAFQEYSSTSLDGGATWSAGVALVETLGPATASVYRIKNTFFLSLYVTSGGNLLSYDNGLTWSAISTNFTNAGNNTVTYYNDTATAVAYVQDNTSYASLYVSTDGLHTWQFTDSSENYAPGIIVDNNVLVAAYTYYNGASPGQIIRSSNYGASWDTVLTTALNISILQLYNLSGIYYAYADSGSTEFAYKSTDKGLTWTPLPNWPPYTTGIPLSNGNYLEVQQQANVYNPLGSSESVAENFVPSQDSFFITETGINCFQVNQLFSNKNVLFASANDDLYRSADGGQTWVPTGKGFYPVWDMLFIGDTAFAATTDYVAWSYNNGLTWDSTLELPQNSEDIQDFATLAYLNGRVIYASNGFQYTDDYGITWDTLPIFPHSNFIEELGNVIVSNNALLAIGIEGGIYQFNNNTQEWDSIITVFGIGAHTGCNFYVVDSVLIASDQVGLVTTTNLFQSWSRPACSGLPYDSSAMLPFPPKNIISVNGLWICSAGPSGLYQSSDQGQTWQLFQGSALPFTTNYYIKDITVMNNVIYSDAYNGGVWRLTDSISNISGVVYSDLNNNGQRDPGEPGIAHNIVYTVPSEIFTSTDTAGNYSLATFATGDTIRPALPVFYAGVKPAYLLSTGSSAGSQNFGIYIPSDVADLSIDITNVSAFGWNQSGNQIVVTAVNKGSLPQPGTVQFNIDSGLSYISAVPAPNSVSAGGDTLTWITDTLQLLQSAVFSVTVSPDKPIGSAVVCHAQVTPVIHDTMPADNYAVLTDSITGPFDPNSKTCLQGSLITPQQVANHQELDYVVRFQNDGNAPAVNVTVADTLSRFFDLSTFHIISSSSPVQFNLKGNAVNFNFNNINLLPESVSADSSRGFVKYGVRCKTSLNLGNVIANTASTYFDNNPAVVTNTALTGVGFSTAAYNSFTTNVVYIDAQPESIKVFPNPTSALLNIEFTETVNTGDLIQIYDETGRLTKTVEAEGQLQKIYMDGFSNGIYFGQVVRQGTLQAAFRFVLCR